MTLPAQHNAIEVGADWLLLVGFWRFGIYEKVAGDGGCDVLRAFVKREDARVVGPSRY